MTGTEAGSEAVFVCWVLAVQVGRLTGTEASSEAVSVCAGCLLFR